MVSAGVSSGTRSGDVVAGVDCVVVGTAGVVSIGWAMAADPPTATISTVVLAIRHRLIHLCRDMTEPRWGCESICDLLLFGWIGTAVAPSLLSNLNGFSRITNAPDNTCVTNTVRPVLFTESARNPTYGARQTRSSLGSSDGSPGSSDP